MKTLEELNGERERLKQAMIAVDKEIARHPQTLRDAFKHNPSWDMEEFEKLVSRVKFARWRFDQPSDELRVTSWDTCVIEFDGKVYRLRFGVSRTTEADLLEYGPLKEETPLDLDIVDELWEQEEPIGYLRGEKGITDDWLVVGYLLTLSLGADEE
jgi:hypothetical protein